MSLETKYAILTDDNQYQLKARILPLQNAFCFALIGRFVSKIRSSKVEHSFGRVRYLCSSRAVGFSLSVSRARTVTDLGQRRSASGVVSDESCVSGFFHSATAAYAFPGKKEMGHEISRNLNCHSILRAFSTFYFCAAPSISATDRDINVGQSTFCRGRFRISAERPNSFLPNFFGRNFFKELHRHCIICLTKDYFFKLLLSLFLLILSNVHLIYYFYIYSIIIVNLQNISPNKFLKIRN